jgi:septal ring factor EnvC (AmiA/AmiB activator)
MTVTQMMKEGNPWAGPIAGAIVGGVMSVVFGIFLSNYSSQINATAAAQADSLRQAQSELREHDQKISTLEASDQARKAQDDRTAKAIGDIQTSQGTIGGEVINVRNATDEANRRLDALQKSFDGVIDIVRPARSR